MHRRDEADQTEHTGSRRELARRPRHARDHRGFLSIDSHAQTSTEDTTPAACASLRHPQAEENVDGEEEMDFAAMVQDMHAVLVGGAEGPDESQVDDDDDGGDAYPGDRHQQVGLDTWALG